VDGCVPTRQRLGHRERVSTANADGWREILPRQETRPAVAPVEPHPIQLPQARRIHAELRDRCFNCLSYSHRVASCRLPRRCLYYHNFRYLARDCKRSSTTTSVAKGGNLPRHSAYDNSSASQHAPHGGPPSSDGAAQGAMAGTGSTCRRRRHRRCRNKPARDIRMAHLPTTPTMPLLLLLYSAFPS
jgi:hypothetical protein